MAAALIAMALVACGEAFSVGDGGAVAGPDGSFDAAIDGEGTPVGDAKSPLDGESRDALGDDGPAQPPPFGGDGGGPVGADGGGPVDAAACLRICSSGFSCIAGKCDDRATLQFSATSSHPNNWSYGYFSSLGAAFNPDTYEWTAANSLAVWTEGGLVMGLPIGSNTIDPSVFHNSGTLLTYDGMTIPADTLGLYPGPGQVTSVLRWTAPVAGLYSINATFVGISAPLTTASVGVLVGSVAGANASTTLNKYGGGNTFVFMPASQELTAGENVDFYSWVPTAGDEAPGGVALDAHIVEN